MIALRKVIDKQAKASKPNPQSQGPQNAMNQTNQAVVPKAKPQPKRLQNDVNAPPPPPKKNDQPPMVKKAVKHYVEKSEKFTEFMEGFYDKGEPDVESVDEDKGLANQQAVEPYVEKSEKFTEFMEGFYDKGEPEVEPGGDADNGLADNQVDQDKPDPVQYQQADAEGLVNAKLPDQPQAKQIVDTHVEGENDADGEEDVEFDEGPQVTQGQGEENHPVVADADDALPEKTPGQGKQDKDVADAQPEKAPGQQIEGDAKVAKQIAAAEFAEYNKTYQ